MQSALQLFNLHGTASVSTNHIAEHAGVSPGNLYYHYHNKADIIESLLRQMMEYWDRVWEPPGGRPVRWNDLEAVLERNFSLLWEYRFFHREQVALLGQDESLRETCSAVYRRRITEQALFFEPFFEDGILRKPADPEEMREVQTACWIIVSNWLTFLELSGQAVDRPHMREGIRLVQRLMQPYFIKVRVQKVRFSAPRRWDEARK
ncbi:TetR/AcrR family transcriptional regulator [Paenibacillus oceani]|uniref:TetR/AcrR family transcriptional regulator n=1 Tax=Paenibacillus oceani TaxID=2772510 RepID=UPI001CC24DC0|nr:TetR/AcrR family transcriptional regulator [Paenibacillus oceani]